MFHRISHLPVVLPPYLSKEAKSLISSLLHKNPTERLGNQTILDIMNHPFFKGIDWESIRRQDTPLPLISTSTSESTSSPNQPNYFDSFSYFVDGTDRYSQRIQVKEFLTAWLRSDLSNPIFDSMAAMCYGQIPYRGISHADGNGYFRFMSKNEFVQHCRNEDAVCAGLLNQFKTATVRIEDSAVLFEGDRCTCQWRSWA